MSISIDANGIAHTTGWESRPVNPEQTQMARDFLARCVRTKTGRVHSYGLKHTIERSVGAYVSNGATLAAAVALGITVTPIDQRNPNAMVAVSRRSVKETAAAIRREREDRERGVRVMPPRGNSEGAY